MERRISRREFHKFGIGLTVASVGFGGVSGCLEQETNHYLEELKSEHAFQNEVTKAAISCANDCGEVKLPASMAFDSSEAEYKLFIPGIAKAGFPDIPEGREIRFAPELAAGEIPVEPPMPKRPEWDYDVLINPVFKAPGDRPLVALTIDDGYQNRDSILQTIIDSEVSATFLIIGSIMDQDPEFVKKAQASGRITWGNHTYTHADLSNKSAEYIQNELSRTEQSLKRICGEKVSTIPFMRPPGGARSNASIIASANSGFRTFLWNVSGDAGTQWTASNPQALVNYYMGLLDAQSNPWGSIVLTHFREPTAAALPGIIQGIRDRGMEPVSLDRLYEDGRV